MAAEVVILRPWSDFIGIVEDDCGRRWRLYSAPSQFRGGVFVRAVRGAEAFGGDFILRIRAFDNLTGEHGQSAGFIHRIARHVTATARGYALASRVA